MKNYYRILNVRSNATDEEIKNNYRTLAKRYHPDVNPDSKEAALKFADVNEAYSVLSDAQTRNEYNRLLQSAVTQRRVPADDFHVYYQAQVQAQVKAQVQAQLIAVRDRAYKEGYNKGASEAAKAVSVETAKSQQKIDEVKRDRGDLEQELFDRDRELAQANERIKELTAQLDWFRKAKGGTAQPTDALQTQISQTKVRIKDMEKEMQKVSKADIKSNPSLASQTNPQQLKERIDALSYKLVDINKRLNDLSGELAPVIAQSEQHKKSAADDQILLSLEQRAAQWAKKEAADRKLSKPTLYGKLGVLVWATDSEIDMAFENLSSRYVGKSDAESFVALKKIKTAYAVLADPKKRREYNATIGITDDRIKAEQKAIRDNAAAQEQYRSKLAAKGFWERFDELSTLAFAGEADAQNALGELYYQGTNVDRDYAQAVYWFREAFAKKNAEATYNLGLCYLHGHGVGRNKSIARAFFRQAENAGFQIPDEIKAKI